MVEVSVSALDTIKPLVPVKAAGTSGLNFAIPVPGLTSATLPTFTRKPPGGRFSFGAFDFGCEDRLMRGLRDFPARLRRH
jgi:hypothetical protein